MGGLKRRLVAILPPPKAWKLHRPLFYDAAHLELDRVVEDLRALGVLAFIASTFSTDDEAPTFRVIIPLATSVDADTYDRLHALVRARLVALGHEIPAGAIDAPHAWYVPVDRCEPGRTYQHAVVDGDLLDPAAVQAEAEAAWTAHRKRAGSDEQREERPEPSVDAPAMSGQP